MQSKTTYQKAKESREEITRLLLQIENAGNSAADLMADYGKRVALEDCERSQEISVVLADSVADLRATFRKLKPIENSLNQEALLLFRPPWWRSVLRVLTVGLVSDGR